MSEYRDSPESSAAAGRREFIRAGLAACAAAAAGSRLSGAQTGARLLKDIGIIGGVPKEMNRDYRKSLARMAEVGYTILEGNSWGPSPQEYLGFLSSIGMKLVSAGVNVKSNMAADWLDGAIALKAQYATAFWPWFYTLETLTMPQLQEIAEQFNRCGKQAKAAGMKVAIHNHDRDFRLLDGKPVFERLIEMTDPELVTVELDLYWIIKAGKDPVDYFKRYPGRFEIFHIKDMGPEPERAICVVGSGSIDFARIFAHSDLAGVKYYIVEQQEGQANTMKAAEDSYRHLRQLRF